MPRPKKQHVESHLDGAGLMLEYANAETYDLDRLTFNLRDPASTAEAKHDVARCYLSWLVFARQVAVSVNDAGQAADQPCVFKEWWRRLDDDETHQFFRNQRNAGLKRVADIITAQAIIDPRISSVAYWTFPDGPHRGEPLVARCQKYNEWLYYSMLAPARELLFEPHPGGPLGRRDA